MDNKKSFPAPTDTYSKVKGFSATKSASAINLSDTLGNGFRFNGYKPREVTLAAVKAKASGKQLNYYNPRYWSGFHFTDLRNGLTILFTNANIGMEVCILENGKKTQFTNALPLVSKARMVTNYLIDNFIEYKIMEANAIAAELAAKDATPAAHVKQKVGL